MQGTEERESRRIEHDIVASQAPSRSVIQQAADDADPSMAAAFSCMRQRMPSMGFDAARRRSRPAEERLLRQGPILCSPHFRLAERAAALSLC